MDLISDLKVMTIVSFCWPQLDVDSWACTLTNRLDMGGEGEVGVKSDPQDLRGQTQCEV